MVGAFAALVIAGMVGGVWFLGTQAALDMLLERAMARSNGRLAIDGATGSLLSTVHIERLRWRGDDVALDAAGIALTWSPLDLFSRRFNVQGFAAQQLTATVNLSSEASTLPADLALPLEVTIARAGIGRIDWIAGNRSGVVTGLAFGYAGGATQHQLRNLEFVTPAGTLSGNLTLGAVSPFALTAALVFTGDGDYRDASARAELNGTLAALGVEAKVLVRGARGTASAKLEPFGPVALTAAAVNVDGVDLARWSPSLPATKLSLVLDAAPAAERFAGTIDVRNAEPGPIDADRIPLATLKSNFSWTTDGVELTDATATMPARGRVTGRAAFAFDGKPATFALDVVDVDLQQIHRALVVTALRGTLAADVSGAMQSVRGDLRQAGMNFAFAATVRDRQLDIARLRVVAGTGELEARGRLALDGARNYSVNGSTRRLDPSRFGAFPVGSLDTNFSATGALSPTWAAAGEMTIAAGSKLSGVPLSGDVRGDLAPRRIRNAKANLHIASGALTAVGNAGAAGDQLSFALRAPDLAALRQLVPPTISTRLPAVVSGSLRASGMVQLEPQLRGGDVDVHGSDLMWGSLFAVTSVDARATLAPPDASARSVAMEERPVTLTVNATGVKTPQGLFTATHLDVTGSVARHTARFTLQGEGVDLQAAATGGLQEPEGSGSAMSRRWSGTLDRLDNRGDYAVALTAPANLVVTGGHVALTDASVRIAEGYAQIADFSLDDGRISSHGSFNAIPLAVLVRMAGQKMPVRSTLTLKGDWSVVASPRLNGAIHVGRDQGDLYATSSTAIDSPTQGFGITMLEVSRTVRRRRNDRARPVPVDAGRQWKPGVHRRPGTGRRAGTYRTQCAADLVAAGGDAVVATAAALARNHRGGRRPRARRCDRARHLE